MNDKIYVAGHRGLIGSAIVRVLRSQGYTNILTKSHNSCDLTDPVVTNLLFQFEQPDIVF